MLTCGGTLSVHIWYIYIYIRNQGSGSIWFLYIDNTTCKPNHKALLAKEIFDEIKWRIIDLGASPCKSVFCDHQRCFIFHCPGGALKWVVLLSSVQQEWDPVFTFTTLRGTKPLTYGELKKISQMVTKTVRSRIGYSTSSFRRGGVSVCSRLAFPLRW